MSAGAMKLYIQGSHLSSAFLGTCYDGSVFLKTGKEWTGQQKGAILSFLFKHILFLFMYACVHPCVYTLCQKRICFPGARILNDCELPRVLATKQQFCTRADVQMLLVTELSFQFQWCSLLYITYILFPQHSHAVVILVHSAMENFVLLEA